VNCKTLKIPTFANSGQILLPDSKLQMLELLISLICTLREKSFEFRQKNMPANITTNAKKGEALIKIL